MTDKNPPQPDITRTIEEILQDLVNFVQWEKDQEWKENYDRKANVENSKSIAVHKLVRLVQSRKGDL